jgi:CMP-N-acetylneuraminic acid synthetase
LASDSARIDDALRHCVEEIQRAEGWTPDAVVILYANVPVRAQGIVDRTIEKLESTGADSVQTLVDVGKFHPDWLYEVIGGDRARKYTKNSIHRRQDLRPLYAIDGAVGVVTWQSLRSAAGKEDPHAFWGEDRRALVQEAHETVDIDCFRDFFLAEAALRERGF